jgi:hypothetical protein
VISDADVNTGLLVALLVELVTENHGGDGEYDDDEHDSVAIHGAAPSLSARPHGLDIVIRAPEKSPGRQLPAGVTCRTLASMGGIEGVRRHELCMGLAIRLFNIEQHTARSTEQFYSRDYRRRLRLIPPAAAKAVIVDPAVAMATLDIGTARHTSNDPADDRARRACNNRAAAGADGNAFPRSGLRRERHTGQR